MYTIRTVFSTCFPGKAWCDFAVGMFEHPDQLHAEARQKCDETKERIRRQVDTGANFFILCYDFGFNTGPFISPGHFGGFVAPYLTEIAGVIHDLNKNVLLHSDGDINKLFDQIYATGGR